MLSLIDAPNSDSEKLSGMEYWMLDSGASCHMAGNVLTMTNVKKIAPVAIGLPNGTYTLAREKGTVVLGEGLRLDNVLCVPKLNCNLVSISKLCKQLNCAVTYFDDFCVIQDRTSRIPIGSGEQRDGVYYYKNSSPSQVNAVKARCLWHRRLEHPSSEVLFLLPQSLGIACSNGGIKDETCNICF